ncbi:MAG: hypothetical protein AAFV95_28405 [Bacteroidota bacterium]
MITQEKAISILDEYLELAYNVDPTANNLKAHRLHIEEAAHWWVLQDCPEGTEYTEGSSGKIGTSDYYITKDEGLMYKLGLWQSAEWRQNYEMYKNGKKTTLGFSPTTNAYLDCQLIQKADQETDCQVIEIDYQDRTEATRNLLQKIIADHPDGNFQIGYQYLPIDGIKSNIKIRHNGRFLQQHKPISEVKECISLPFTGGYDKVNDTRESIKKYMRVHGHREPDDFWVEVLERDIDKRFEDWRLLLYSLQSGWGQ